MLKIYTNRNSPKAMLNGAPLPLKTAIDLAQKGCKFSGKSDAVNLFLLRLIFEKEKSSKAQSTSLLNRLIRHGALQTASALERAVAYERGDI